MPVVVDRCPTCQAPTHASETDDTGRCATCRGEHGIRVDIPAELVRAIDRYLKIPNSPEHRLAALNGVAYIGERVATIVRTQNDVDARNALAEASAPPVQQRTVRHPVRHPMQPVVLESGVARFRANRIVRWLVDERNLNEIVSRYSDAYPHGGGPDYPEPGALEGEYHDDYQQLMQLIGYSIEGYAELSRHNPDVYAVARAAAEKL